MVCWCGWYIALVYVSFGSLVKKWTLMNFECGCFDSFEILSIIISGWYNEALWWGEHNPKAIFNLTVGRLIPCWVYLKSLELFVAIAHLMLIKYIYIVRSNFHFWKSLILFFDTKHWPWASFNPIEPPLVGFLKSNGTIWGLDEENQIETETVLSTRCPNVAHLYTQSPLSLLSPPQIPLQRVLLLRSPLRRGDQLSQVFVLRWQLLAPEKTIQTPAICGSPERHIWDRTSSSRKITGRTIKVTTGCNLWNLFSSQMVWKACALALSALTGLNCLALPCAPNK